MQAEKIAILGSPDSWHCQQLQSALEALGAQVNFTEATLLIASLGRDFRVSGAGLDLGRNDLLLVREVPGGSLEQVIYRMDALHQLENAGLRIINSPYAIEKMVDKYYTLSLLQQAGLPVPETLVCEDFATALDSYQALGGDVVVKPLFGSRGIGMVRVSDPDSAWRALKALQLGGYVYYLQKYIPHANRDLRVLVVGGACVAAMERAAGSWKTNIAAGAQPVAVQIDAEVELACLQAASVLGADYCGVDLVRSDIGELFVLEVNSMPAWQGLQQVTSFDIARRIADFCLSTLSDKRRE